MAIIQIWTCTECNEVGTLINSIKVGEYLVFTCHCKNCSKDFDVKINERDFFNTIKNICKN